MLGLKTYGPPYVPKTDRGCPSNARLDHIELDGGEQLTFGEGQRILIGICIHCIDSQVI